MTTADLAAEGIRTLPAIIGAIAALVAAYRTGTKGGLHKKLKSLETRFERHAEDRTLHTLRERKADA